MGRHSWQSCAMAFSLSLLLLAATGPSRPSHWHPRYALGGSFFDFDQPSLLGPALGPTLHRIQPELDISLVSGRFKLKHHDHDGLEEVLDAYDVSKEGIESLRDATIITTIEVEDDFVSISTSDADNPEQENTVVFTVGETHEIINPLNGETVELVATVLPYHDTDSLGGSRLWHYRDQDLDLFARGGDGHHRGAEGQPALPGGVGPGDGQGGQQQG